MAVLPILGHNFTFHTRHMGYNILASAAVLNHVGLIRAIECIASWLRGRSYREILGIFGIAEGAEELVSGPDSWGRKVTRNMHVINRA